MAGGTAAGQTSHHAMNQIIEDDSVKMMRLVEREFVDICEQYLLTENEVYESISLLKKCLTKSELKNIYASQNREIYIQSIILDAVQQIVNKRMIINNLRDEDIFWGMRILIEDAIDGEGIFDEKASLVGVSQVQTELLSKSNICDEQMAQIMQPVMQMNRTQLRTERTLRSMKRNNEETADKIYEIMSERELLKSELSNLLEE